MEQDRRRAEKEDLEFKAMIPLTQSDTPPGNASYHRRRISGFQSVMPTRLIFDNTVEWDDRTAQLGGRRRRLSPLQMSTVDQTTAATDGKIDGHHCRRPSIERSRIIKIQPSQLIHRRHQTVLKSLPGTTEIDMEMQKEGAATRTTTGRQPTADHVRCGTRPTAGGCIGERDRRGTCSPK